MGTEDMLLLELQERVRMVTPAWKPPTIPVCRHVDITDKLVHGGLLFAERSFNINTIADECEALDGAARPHFAGVMPTHHGMLTASFYKWRSKYGVLDASMISQMNAL
jgi:hypothetical protein